MPNQKQKSKNYLDGSGLYLLITPSGGKLWRFKYRIECVEKRLTFKTYPEISLADARHRRDDARKLIANGVDPVSIIKAQKEEKVVAETTFEKVAREWFSKNEPVWSDSHCKTVKSRLERDVYPCYPTRQRQQEVTPVLENITALPKALGRVTEFIADCGYFSETNVTACEQKQITPYIAVDRQSHNQPMWDRFREPPPLPDDADAVTRMKHRLKTVAGKAVYAARKRTVEPVFGVIKSVMGFRSFLLRGFESVQGEWDLVCIAWNIKRLHGLVKAI